MKEKHKQKQVQDGGHATFSVKVTQEVYELVNILASGLAHGTNGNDLLKMFIHTFIESAKHDGPMSEDMKTFLNMLKMEPGWHKAFNFADVTAQNEVAQIILVLQQPGRKGFGLTMIDRPFMGEATVTYCLDDILERIIKLSMPGLDKRLEWIEQQFHCTSRRETLLLLCEYMSDYLKREQELSEMPGYGNYHDFGKAIEYGKKTKSIHHKGVEIYDRQTTIRFTDEDRAYADEEVDRSNRCGDCQHCNDDNPYGKTFCELDGRQVDAETSACKNIKPYE